MLNRSYPPRVRAPRKKQRNLFPTALLVAISMSPLAYFVDFQHRSDEPREEQVSSIAAPALVQVATAPAYDPALVDPTPAMKADALHFTRNAPLQSSFKSSPVRQQVAVAPAAPEAPAPAVEPTAPVVALAEAVQPLPAPVPLPVPRPTDLMPPRVTAAQTASIPARASVTPRTVTGAVAIASPPADNRSFIEKFFGIKPATPPEAALSYASLDNGTGSISPTSRFVPSPGTGSGGTAVYDITAQVVIMPNGERLEAHSGLGDMMDNPRYVNVRMKGATPPGTYVITEREALFHGVRALRLTPVGGSGAIYGRDGILAHTYMLGPRGDSNGCVSFRNYDR
ncbi:DUF2778 domain-containing protein, partial [Vibrio parahaemolyticus]|nr:DUF2778 domain-containing protein [Vibrio parahaemolyticus]